MPLTDSWVRVMDKLYLVALNLTPPTSIRAFEATKSLCYRGDSRVLKSSKSGVIPVKPQNELGRRRSIQRGQKSQPLYRFMDQLPRLTV